MLVEHDVTITSGARAVRALSKDRETAHRAPPMRPIDQRDDEVD